MSTMTRPLPSVSDTRPHPIKSAALVVLFWVLAATAAAIAHAVIDPLSIAAGSATAIAALLGAAYAYMRLAAREARITHALGVGIAWLVFAIVSEIVVTSHVGHDWYGLLGSPDHPLLRNIFLFAWIFSPAIFVRLEDET